MKELTEQQIQAFRQLLLDIRTELQEILAVSKESTAVVILDQSKVGRLSRMDAMQQQQMANANREGYKKRLECVEQALQAITDECYGYCDKCGEGINHQRLRVRPESLLCIDCQAVCEH